MAPKSKSKSKSTATAQSASASTQNKNIISKPPNWPPLQPTHPVNLQLPSSTSLLTVDTLLPSQIYLIRNFFSASLCRTYISFLSSQIPLVTTPGGFRPKKGEAVRVNDRFQVHDEAFAKGLWERMGLESAVRSFVSADDPEDGDEAESAEERVGEDVWGGKLLGLNPNIRIYRYSPGQFFAKHYDESNTLTFDRQPAKTTFTLLIYLSVPAGGGGETVFYLDDVKGPSNAISVAPEVGMALLHRHGDQCLLHEGKEVYPPAAGGGSGGVREKWVIRSDLVVTR